MDWWRGILEVIDMGSFSALWYWIVLAVTWSLVSHWVMGVPYDLLQRARRRGGDAFLDVEALARINARRILTLVHEGGAGLAGVVAFLHTVLGVLAFWYGIEFAQALVFLLWPLTAVAALGLRTARRIEALPEGGEAMVRLLVRHRVATQGIGMAAIFVTAMWGMWHNFAGLAAF